MEFNNSKESAQLKASGAGRQLRARHGAAGLSSTHSSRVHAHIEPRRALHPCHQRDRIGSDLVA